MRQDEEWRAERWPRSAACGPVRYACRPRWSPRDPTFDEVGEIRRNRGGDVRKRGSDQGPDGLSDSFCHAYGGQLPCWANTNFNDNRPSFRTLRRKSHMKPVSFSQFDLVQ